MIQRLFIIMLAWVACFFASAQKKTVPRFIGNIELQTMGSSKTSTINGGKTDRWNPQGYISTEQLGLLELKFAQLLDVEAEKLADRPLLSYLEKWVNENGLNDHYREARVAQYGFAGLMLQDVYQFSVPETLDKQLKAYSPLAEVDWQLGDVVFFGKKDNPDQTGIYLTDGYIADLDSKNELRVRSLNDKNVRKRLIAVCRPLDGEVSR